MSAELPGRREFILVSGAALASAAVLGFDTTPKQPDGCWVRFNDREARWVAFSDLGSDFRGLEPGKTYMAVSAGSPTIRSIRSARSGDFYIS